MPIDIRDLYIGLMCGTSADGVDAALVHFPPDTQPELLATHEQELPEHLRNALLALNHAPNVSLQQLSTLDTQVAELHAEAVSALLSNAKIKPERIRAIGFHGQTIYHAPHPPISNTTQIGNSHLLAAKTGITVIGDVRRGDIAVGGQGAPLAPALHTELLRSSSQDVAVVNIGGIANLSLLPAVSTKDIIGFDTGPGNCLMDEWACKHLNKPYDEHGRLAESGQIDQPLLSELLNFEFFNLPPPKSTGRDVFNLAWLQRRLKNKNIRVADVQTTLLALSSRTISDALHRYLPSARHLYVCGGGVKNIALMNQLQQLLPNTKVESTKNRGIEPEWMEAILMAWLARKYCLDQTSNLPSVTGAKSFVRLGVRFDPPQRAEI